MGLVLASAMLAPPARAALVRLTVQVLEELGPTLVGLHVSEEINTGATRLTVVLAELLLYVAVRVALLIAADGRRGGAEGSGVGVGRNSDGRRSGKGGIGVGQRDAVRHRRRERSW